MSRNCWEYIIVCWFPSFAREPHPQKIQLRVSADPALTLESDGKLELPEPGSQVELGNQRHQRLPF